MSVEGVADIATLRAENAALAVEWRAVAMMDCGWRDAPNQAGVVGYLAPGEAGGRYVTCDRYPHRRAYLKPTKRDPAPKNARAAREKIASDLAHDLGVPVPPVVLASACRDTKAVDEKYVAVSLVMFPKQWAWAQTKRLIYDLGEAGPLIRSTAYSAAAKGFVLDTWLNQTDHTENHDHNIVFGYSPSDTAHNQLLLLDYAFSLGFGGGWDEGRFSNCTAAPFPRILRETLDKKVLEETLIKVEAMTDDVVKDVVERVPEPFLAADQKAVLVEGLLARRGLVRPALSAYLST